MKTLKNMQPLNQAIAINFSIVQIVSLFKKQNP